MFKKTISIVIALVAVCALSNTRSYAEESHAVIPEPVPQVWKYGWSGDPKWDDAIFEGLKGNCAPLKPLEALDLGKYDYFRLGFIGELFDRGICRAADPAKAATYFQRAMDNGSPIYSRNILGWKYWHGHGVEQDLPKARQLFQRAVLRRAMMPSYFRGDRLKDILKGRTVPEPLLEGITWLKEQHASKASLKTFARNLVRGTGTYIDGSKLVGDRNAALWIFFRYANDVEMRHAGVLEVLAGKFGNKDIEWARGSLRRNTNCRYIPSILLMAEVYDKGLLGQERNAGRAYVYYSFAKRLGADVDAPLKRIEAQIPHSHSVEKVDFYLNLRMNNSCDLPRANVKP